MASTYALPRGYGHSHSQSWQSDGPQTPLYKHSFKNSFGSGSLHPDDALDAQEDGDSFNPSGLHGGHTRTHSFTGQRSPMRASFSNTRAADADVPSPVMEEDMPVFAPSSYTPTSLSHNHNHNHNHNHSHDHDHEHAPKHDHDHDHDHSYSHDSRNHSHSHSQNHVHSHSHSHSHAHNHSHSHIPVPVFAPPPTHGHGHNHSHSCSQSHAPVHASPLLSSPASSSWLTLPEALTGLLIPLPYLLASAAYSSSDLAHASFPPLSAYAQLKQAVRDDYGSTHAVEHAPSLLQASTLTSGTLLLVGILAKIRSEERSMEKRKNSNAALRNSRLLSTNSLTKMVTGAVRTALPYYAAIQLGGTRVGMVVLMAVASGLACSHNKPQPAARTATLGALFLCLLADFFGLTIYTDAYHLITGYLALALSVVVLPPPLPSNGHSASPLTASPMDITTTLSSGVALSIITVSASILFSLSPPVSATSITLSTLSIAATAGLVLFAQPSAIRSAQKGGLAMGTLLTAASAFLFSPTIWPGTICNGALSALSCIAVMYDTSTPSHDHSHAHHDDHHHHEHEHHHHPHTQTPAKVSFITSLLLSKAEPNSLIHSILSEKDSRRIAYFTCLNFSFMLVQAFYGWASGSLGLLSDTVHMFFDCLGLVVGLGAAVASKWPTSPEKPYGWGKLNTLAGFGNGIFLMLVSVEFVWEAVEGIMEGTELRRVQELLVVSILGFLVNMVGLLAFGHAHAGHDHGGHSHGHSHSHDHSGANGDLTSDAHSHSHGHGHAHGNENMHGIYLHIAADAGGSLAVILSTFLTLWKPWYLWDPLATIAIAILIFLAAVPLVKESGRKLLLVIPDELEYPIKTALQDVSAIRGVGGYAVPRFWVEEAGEAADAHAGHGHDHGHAHGHNHGEEDEGAKKRIAGVIHVFAVRAADMDDVRERVVEFFAERDMHVVVQVEREGLGRCWCGGGYGGSGGAGGKIA